MHVEVSPQFEIKHVQVLIIKLQLTIKYIAPFTT